MFLIRVSFINQNASDAYIHPLHTFNSEDIKNITDTMIPYRNIYHIFTANVNSFNRVLSILLNEIKPC